MKALFAWSLFLGFMLGNVGQNQSLAGEPSRAELAHGILFLPLDFYPTHQKELGLADDQVQKMREILQDMRKPAEALSNEMREQTQALQEAMSQSPVDADKAMDRFEHLMQSEKEMKVLQFRTRLALREILTPTQFERLRDMAVKATQGSAAGSQLPEKLQQVHQQIKQRYNGQIPRELLEKLERIERSASRGRNAEAEEELNDLLHHLAGGNEARKAVTPEMQRQLEKLEQAMKQATDPSQRAEIERQIDKLQASQHVGQSRPGTQKRGGEELEQQMRHIAEAAKRSDNPEVREQLQHALHKLEEAAAAGNHEAVSDILKAVNKLFERAKQ